MIRLDGVYKAFGSRPILENLDLEVNRGETVVIIGRSGIGKSVTLRHIVGLLEADRGKVVVFGKNVTDLSKRELKKLRSRIGYLFQDGALLNWLTVGENVALPLRENTTLSDHEIRERVQRALNLVELEEAWHKYPSEISGGMRKRSGLARALIVEPEIILYDEPTSGLDPISSSVINHLVNQLKQRLEVTQIVVTHDMDSAYTIADRIALLHHGRVHWIGTPEEIKSSTDEAVVQFIQGLIAGPLSHSVQTSIPAAASPGAATPVDPSELS